MMYSKSVEYAIQALAHLAELPEGGQRMARLIAEKENLPAFFLAKTLQSLARQGLLHSLKGPTGGFGLNKPANKIRLIDVIECLDGLDAFQNDPGLPNFRAVRSTVMGYLRETTIADVAKHRVRRRKAAQRSKTRKARRGR